MLKLSIDNRAGKFIDKLDRKQLAQILNKLYQLLAKPEPHDSIIVENSNARRVDIGEYRIIYDYNEEEVRIILVGKRNDDDVYKRFDRLH